MILAQRAKFNKETGANNRKSKYHQISSKIECFGMFLRWKENKHFRNRARVRNPIKL